VRGGAGTVARWNDRWIPVEDVIYAGAEVDSAVEHRRRVGQREVEIILWFDMDIELVAGHVGHSQRRLIGRPFEKDLADMAPIDRYAQAERHLQRRTGLVAPLRHRRTAGHGVA